jgi:transcriptional regulator with XRE-family HTH domain
MADESPTPIGQQLARRREELDLTQQALAQRVGISVNSVSAAERGRATISVGKRPAWEAALELRRGTLGRAYRDSTDLEPATGSAPQEELPYDPTDVMEAHLWKSAAPESIRRRLIRDYRRALAEVESEQAAESRRRHSA